LISLYNLVEKIISLLILIAQESFLNEVDSNQYLIILISILYLF